ncbi:hypothetical protein M433DRAFT_28959, partial [Acidomyces richmondensis BFW]
PNSRTWTLHFKHHRTTILLHVDPLQKLSSIRAELLKAIQQTSRDGKLNGHNIPSTESDVLLAKPKDAIDLSQGWEPLAENDIFSGNEKSGKGKGKITITSASNRTSKDKLLDCPQGAGLRDGGVVAFKFRSEQEAQMQDAKDEAIDVDEDDKLDGETLVGEPSMETWDVVVPSLEDAYGEQEVGGGQ